MTIDGNNTHTEIFYGHSFRPQPEVPFSTEHSLITPDVPDTANIADGLGPQAEPTAGADLVYLCDLQPRPVEWLWKDRLACGTLSMISGVPGSGKTWIALSIAAALSRGRAPSLAKNSNLAPSYTPPWSTTVRRSFALALLGSTETSNASRFCAEPLPRHRHA
jgi:AAA domain